MEGTLAFGGTTYLDGFASDPRKLEWMKGFPPSARTQITFEGGRHLAFPEIRWSLSHMRELVPTVNVARSDGDGFTFNEPSAADEAAVAALGFTDLNGRERRFDEALFDTYTDGIMVLHRGRVVFERYFGSLERKIQHACFSVTKSYAGTIATALVHERVLEEGKTISYYVPELRGTGWEDATLRQVLDMETGLDFDEDHVDDQSRGAVYMRSCRTRSRPANYDGPQTSCEFLRTVRKRGEHGKVFSYKSVNTQVVGWVMSRVTGCSFPQLLHDRLWAPLGCEDDGYMVVDPAGMPSVSGGLYASLRDMARFGELIRQEGGWNGRQILPASVIADIRRGGDQAKFSMNGMPGYSYRAKWWVSHNEFDAIEAQGIHGQRIYIAPRAEMVIAQFSSHPMASTVYTDAIIGPQTLELARFLGG
ncbi:MAG: serine hydrolase [Mesorhizobium sp.]|nr:MAG: serine hydrolase [Mesorhizobium sp.]TIR47629.1 MAG: serine hydrolase [Mesorhizobium sp.]TJV92870.1 MAG: serine hydrolase [Mesorhizobium sp.]